MLLTRCSRASDEMGQTPLVPLIEKGSFGRRLVLLVRLFWHPGWHHLTRRRRTNCGFEMPLTMPILLHRVPELPGHFR